MHTVYIPEVTVRVKLPFCDQPFDLWLPLLTSLLCKAYLHIEGEGKKKASFSKQNPKRHSAAEYVSFCAWQGNILRFRLM